MRSDAMSSRAGGSPGTVCRLAIPFACAVLGATLLTFGAVGFPVPMIDAEGFLPAAIFFRQGAGLINPVYEGILPTVDPLGQSRFLYYPPLFPLVVGALMPSRDQGSALLAIALLRALSLFGFALLMSRALRRAGIRRDGLLTLAFVLSLVGLCTGYMPAEGRPEALGGLLLLAAAAAALELRDPWRTLALGVALGLMGATHPVGAVLLGLLIGCYEGAIHGTAAAAWRLALIAALGLLTTAAVVIAGPFGLEETIRGIAERAESSVVAEWSWSSYPWRWWLLAGRTSFLGVLLVTGLAAAAALALAHRDRIGSPIVFQVSAALFLAGTYYFSVRNPYVYNIQMFAPLLYAAMLLFLGLRRDALAAPARRLVTVGAVGVLALSGAGFVRYAALFAAGPGWVPLEEGQRAFRAADRCAGSQIHSEGPTWMLARPEDLRRLTSYCTRETLLEAAGPCVLLSPAMFALGDELERRGYRLTASLAPAGTPSRPAGPAWTRGYAFRLYEREEAPYRAATERAADASAGERGP